MTGDLPPGWFDYVPKNTTFLDLTAPAGPSQPDRPLIRLRQVTKNYRTAAGDFPALRGIDLDIYPGELVGVLGKSGAGKTTLVNLISGVDHLPPAKSG